MKFTKLFAASFAAATLFSCSNELEETNPMGSLNPGDALIEFNLNGSGTTTYATDAEESLVKNSLYALYNTKTGALIPTTPTQAQSATKISFTVSADNITNNEDSRLVVVANTTGFTSNGTAAIAMPATLTEAQAMKIQGELTDNKAALPNGLPSSMEYPLTLQQGTITPPTAKLKRAAARLFVKNETLAPISGYEVIYTGRNSANLVARTAAIGAVAGTTHTYSILDAIPANSKTQPVGYLYPGATTIQVKGGGITKDVPLTSVAANKNYGINIIPKTTTDGSFDFDVAIDEWEAGTDADVDMNSQFAAVEPTELVSPYITVTQKKDGIILGPGVQFSANVGEFVNRADIQSISLVNSLAPSGSDPLEITINGTDLAISTLDPYTGIEVTKILKITSATGIEYMYIILNKDSFVDNLSKVLVSMNGNDWMPFNTSGDLKQDQKTATAIITTAGDDMATKVVNYAYATKDNYQRISGTFFTGKGSLTACPSGYKVANLAAYTAMAGVAVPVRPGTGADKWLKSEANSLTPQSQDLGTATIAKVGRSLPAGVTAELKWYWTLTDKKTNNVLPFIGSSSNGVAGGNEINPLMTAGMGLWTGESRNATDYERVAPWNDGWANNAAADAPNSTSYVRCVKAK